MNQDRERAPILLGAIAPDSIQSSRRRLVVRLAALPGALGLAFFFERDGNAKKGNRKKRKRRGGKNKGKGGGGGGYSPDGEERAFLDLINDYRRKNSAGNLSLQNNLGAAAEAHSRDMAKRNYFRHASQKNFERHGYKNWKAIGENIAAGQETAKQVFEDWKKSRDHDKNMRSKNFTEIGIGRAHSKKSKYGWYWTTTFGDR
ncbi:MAG: CAP domain-containing protein [Thermomicrobiales bacterium]